MISGDPTDWDTFFRSDLVPMVLDCVATAWSSLAKPGPSDGETDISLKLYCQLVKVKNRSSLPFRFGYEVVEVDVGTVAATGRKDIVVHPRGTDREEIYLCLEAKRLNVLQPSGWASLAGEYVTEGMQRFVDSKYASAVLHGVMLGYVLDGNLKVAKQKVDAKAREHCKSLGMTAPGGLANSSLKPQSRSIRESRHTRSHDSKVFCIHHVFLGKGKPRNANGEKLRHT